MTEYKPLLQPDEISITEKEDAMGAYLMMFAALAVGLPLPVINLVAAIVYFYLNKKRSPFVHFHSLQSLLSQIPTSLMNAVLIFWTVRAFFLDWSFTDNYWGYMWTVIAANLIYIGFSIYAAVKARRGEMVYFIFFGRISYEWVYRINEDRLKEVINRPPK
jgi:uncharacterized membrane protein